MAKTTKSFSIEEDIYEYIVKYKEDNGLSSVSAALERIILSIKYSERKEDVDIRGIIELIKKSLVDEMSMNNKLDINKGEENKKNDPIENSINDILSTMPIE